MDPSLRIRLLGSFTIEIGGRAMTPEAIGRKRARDVLQLLALTPAHRVSREHLIATLWPEKDTESGANNLHRALHDLRQAIGNDFVHAEKGHVRLGDGVWVDVTEFDALARSRESEKLASALALYRGDLAADESLSPFIAQRREQLRTTFCEAALRAAQQASDPRAAIDLLRRVLASDPTNEEAHRLLMRRLADSGRRAEALRQFEECERVLRELLDTAPGPQTRQVHETILRGDNTATVRPQTTGWERVARRLLGNAQPPAMRGRLDTTAVVQEFARGSSGVLLLVGEAGIGKTHAAVEGARVASMAGAVLFCGAALEFERSAPYAPFIDAWSDYLRTAGLGPEENPFLAFSVSPGGNPQEDKLRLFQSAQRSLETLSGGRPVYFILDDLHFADESTLHLFHYLARASRTTSLLLVGTCREEELELNAPLHALVSGIYRERLGKRIVLNRLDREATRAMIEDRVGEQLADNVVQSIYRLTEGNPFFTEEVLHSMRGSGDTPTVTTDLTSVIVERVQRLGNAVEQLLTAGAVLGHTFDYDLARRIAGLGDGALDALELGLAARLIEEDETRYRFRHGLVRESLYRRISRVRRNELHRRAADAIEQISCERVEELAFHLRTAGELRRALPYLIESGRRAAARLGLAEAVSFYQQALAAMDELALPPDEQRFKVLLRLGQIDFSLSNLEAAVRELDAAAELGPSRSDRAKARRCAALALITAGELAEANQRLEAAMEDLRGEEHSSEYPHVLYHLAQLRWHEGRHHDAYGVAERCLREAERQGDPNVIAKGYEILSLSCHSLGEWKSGIEFEERRRALVGSSVDVAQAFDVHL